MAQMSDFIAMKGGGSPQSPLEVDAVFESLEEDLEVDARSMHLLSYSTEISFLLDAAPEISCLSSSARSSTWWRRRVCDLVDQKDEYFRKHLKEESLDHLLSTPPGRIPYLQNSLEQASNTVPRASSLFGALHHARAFDSRGQIFHDLQALTLSIPSLEELPPEDLLELAARCNTPDSSLPFEHVSSASEANAPDWGPKSTQGTDVPAIKHSVKVPGQADSLQVVKKETAKDHDRSQSDARSGGERDDVLALWTRAAEQPPAGPIMHTWDTAKDGRIGTDVMNGKQESGEHIKDGAFMSEGGVAAFNQAYVRYASKALNQAPTVVKESDLVRDALFALQGVPSSLVRLESQIQTQAQPRTLARPPLKSGTKPPRIRLLSTSFSSITTLLKPIIEAGRLRQQLESFAQGQIGPSNHGLSADSDSGPGRGLVMQAFGGALQTILLCQTAALDRIGCSIRERRSRERPRRVQGLVPTVAINVQRKDVQSQYRDAFERVKGTDALANGAVVDGPSQDGRVGARRRKKLESLFRTAGSVEDGRDADQAPRTDESSEAAVSSHRPQVPAKEEIQNGRDQKDLDWRRPQRRSEGGEPASNGVNGLSRGGGTVTSNDLGDMTLLELLLHSNELRSQLHVLARLCTRLGGFEVSGEGVGGAELLSRLYNRVLDADPLYADLHRFLLSAACQPYLELIQGWLYQQQVDDPYHEFILQQSDALDPATGMKVFRAAAPPSFLAEVWQPLIRAGQQLRVLMDLPQTWELAQNILCRRDWRHGHTPSGENGHLSRESVQTLFRADSAGVGSSSGADSGGPRADSGLVFSASELRKMAAEARERARKKESEAGWTLTMLAMQERRRREGKLDVIEQHRLDLAKAYDDQRKASVLERGAEVKRKEIVLNEQREEIARRAEAKKKAREALIERERAMLREERERETTEVARVKAEMIAEAEEQLEKLDRQIQAVRERTAAESPSDNASSSGDVPQTPGAEQGDPSLESQSRVAEFSPKGLERTSAVDDESDGGENAAQGRIGRDAESPQRPMGPELSSVSEAHWEGHSGGGELGAEGLRKRGSSHDGLALEEWYRLAIQETSGTGLFGQGSESASDGMSSRGVSNAGGASRAESESGGVTPGVADEAEQGGVLSAVREGIVSSLAGLIPGLGGRRESEVSESGLSDEETGKEDRDDGDDSDMEGEDGGCKDEALGRGKDEALATVDEKTENESDEEVIAAIAELLQDSELSRDTNGGLPAEESTSVEDTASKNEESAPTSVDGQGEGTVEENEATTSGRSGPMDVQGASKWGPVQDLTLAAGVGREGLGSGSSAREAARRGMEQEGRGMREVMDGGAFDGFGGFKVPKTDVDLPSSGEDGGIPFERSANQPRWGLSANPFAAAGMTTKELGDTFAAQDFRFVGEIDFWDKETTSFKSATAADGLFSEELGRESTEELSGGQDSDTPVRKTLFGEGEHGFWSKGGSDNLEETDFLRSEPSKEALAFLSPIPSGSKPALEPDISPVSFSSPVAPTGHRQSPLSATPGSPVASSPGRSPLPTPKPSRPANSGPKDLDEDLDAPLSVVMDVCVVQEILAQYRCVSLCCVRVFQEELELPAHCAALRRYLFMLAGDFADAFVSALMSQRWGPSGGASRQAEVQALLEGALQISSCSSDRLAERLHVRVEQSQEELPDFYAPWVKASLTPGGFVNLGRVDAFDFIQLEYRVDGPLTLVLTSAAMAQYQAIFRFLLRTKHAAFSLRDVWRDLQTLSRRLSRRGPNVGVHVFREQQQQLREVQLFRQAISHVVTTLASFVQAQLLDVAWTRYQERVRTEVVDLHDLRQVHSEYLADATRHCLLSTNDAPAKACIDEIFQQLLDFRKHLKRAVRSVDQPAAELEIDEVNEQIRKTKAAFQESFHTLYARHLHPRIQNDPVIGDLCMRLNFNGFVETSIADQKKFG